MKQMGQIVKSLVKLSCLSLAVVASCTSGDSTDEAKDKTVTLDQFTVVDMSNAGKTVMDNPDILGIVGSIEAVNDSLIAVCQNRRDAHVTLCNLNNNKSQPVMTMGEGPMEMLRVNTLSSDQQGNLWMVSMGDRKVMKARWNEEGEHASVEPAFKLPDDCLRGVTDLNGGVIFLPVGKHDLRLTKVDASGEAIDSMGSYPAVEMPADLKPSNFMFQSDMALSPDASKLAIACKSWNYIDIIDPNTKESISLTLQIDEPIILDKYENGPVISYNPKPLWLMFSGVDATDKSFFVGHNGTKVESPEDFQKGMTTILEFDWNGNPLRLLKFENDVVAFSVSSDGNTLYIVENAPDPVLYEYKL